MPRSPRYFAAGSATVERLSFASRAVVIAAATAGLVYFPWRLTTFNPHALLLSAALYGAETFGVIAILLHAFMTWRVLRRTSPPITAEPSVDVFIPTYNEPVEMLRRTLLAAIQMKYPHQTWLLDDGNRPSMAALAKELGVNYLARADNRHAKAGNLNNALAHSTGDLIAIFDADHVPHEDFLMSTLGYLEDPKVAFVQTPQDFYNLNSFQHRESEERKIVWTEQSLFFRVIMPGKDYWNAAFFCGSCAIARRSALESIGGFATETITEDLHTSVRLHKKGFGSVYHAQSLAYGIAPDTFEPYESQRVRWGQGAMQVWRLEGFLTARGLSLAQRLCYLASAMTYFDGWQKAFMYFLPSFVLISGILPIASLDWGFAARFVPWYLLSLWACEELGRGYARSWLIEQYNFLRYPGFIFATFTFFLNRKLRFRVTKKTGSARIENYRRMSPHLAVVAIAVSAIVFGAIRYAGTPYMAASAFLLNVLWASVTILIASIAVRFALGHAKQERASYRFRLPVPIAVVDAHNALYLLASSDISSNGLRLEVPESFVSPEDNALNASLILPSGLANVRLEQKRRWMSVANGDRLLNNAAFGFAWKDNRNADRLDRYLYGSDAQWLYSRLSERNATPMEQLEALFTPPAPLEEENHHSGWQAAIAVPGDFSRSYEVLVRLSPQGDVYAFLARYPLRNKAVALVVPFADDRIAYYAVEKIHPLAASERTMFRHVVSRTAAWTTLEKAAAAQATSVVAA
jgi:cellulose synthase (UDP-forming)